MEKFWFVRRKSKSTTNGNLFKFELYVDVRRHRIYPFRLGYQLYNWSNISDFIKEKKLHQICEHFIVDMVDKSGDYDSKLNKNVHGSGPRSPFTKVFGKNYYNILNNGTTFIGSCDTDLTSDSNYKQIYIVFELLKDYIGIGIRDTLYGNTCELQLVRYRIKGGTPSMPRNV